MGSVFSFTQVDTDESNQWEEMKEELLKAGWQDVINEAQRQVDEFMVKKE